MTTSDSAAPRVPNKSFHELIRTVDRGNLDRDIEAGMKQIMDAVLEHRGAGKITVTLSIKPKSDAFEITGDVEFKKPKRTRLGAVRFFDEESGEFTTRDPNQPDLPGTNVEQLNKVRQGDSA